MENIKEFKAHCSSLHNLMQEKGLGKTGETYLETWVKEQIYQRRKEFTSKYTDKGNQNEDESIDIIADQLGFGMLIKNEKYFENDFICGTPDIITTDLIIDAKSSWDCFTFPLFDSKLNKNYYWQVQGYMWLTGLQQAKVCYVLTDTPVHMIQKEAFWWCKQNGYDELDIDVFNEFIKKMTYKNIPIEKKFKCFDVQRNDKDIELIGSRVIDARKYIDIIIK